MKTETRAIVAFGLRGVYLVGRFALSRQAEGPNERRRMYGYQPTTATYERDRND